MIKIIKVKYLEPREALASIQKAGIIPYLINWGCDVDEQNRRLIFNLRHGSGSGGSFDEELRRVGNEIEQFLKSIDRPREDRD
ncbi:MAG: hypothetical protein D6715_07160 [Calditrichaeota bacterium]|nr:MAG: hypothetical protein D6715_07160 [Calditrichota bacterium]